MQPNPIHLSLDADGQADEKLKLHVQLLQSED